MFDVKTLRKLTKQKTFKHILDFRVLEDVVAQEIQFLKGLEKIPDKISNDSLSTLSLVPITVYVDTSLFSRIKKLERKFSRRFSKLFLYSLIVNDITEQVVEPI